MSARPMVKINAHEFLAGTCTMRAKEAGAFWLLALHFGWHRSIPSDDCSLAKITRLDVRQWRKIKEHVLCHIPRWRLFFEFKGDGKEWERALSNPRPPSDVWSELRAIVFERDGFVCTYCGCANGPFHCDHIEPVVKGGASSLENLTTACAKCNLSKGGKSVAEWRA